jgi:Bacterial extracellular solute-binding protein, family 7/CBS domain
MSLKTILAAKGSEVVSIDFTADLAAAAKLLTKHRIGALVVLGVGGRLAGILSERDIVRMMAESGSAVHHLPVAQAMTRNAACYRLNIISELPRGCSHEMHSYPPHRHGRPFPCWTARRAIQGRVQDVHQPERGDLLGPGGRQVCRRHQVSKRVIPIAWGENGYRELTNSKRPIRRPEDLQGLNIRVVGIPIFVETFQALGANPVSINFNEALEAFRLGKVDGQENPIALIVPYKLWSVHHYVPSGTTPSIRRFSRSVPRLGGVSVPRISKSYKTSET